MGSRRMQRPMLSMMSILLSIGDQILLTFQEENISERLVSELIGGSL
jgi:hypothetical protein